MTAVNEDSLLEDWLTVRATSTQATTDTSHDSNTTLLACWPSKLSVIDNIDHDLLKYAVRDANNNNRSSIDKDELDVTLRACASPLAAKHRAIMNNKHKPTRTTDDSDTTDTVTASSTLENDMLEEFVTRSRSIDDEKDSDTGHIRRNSLDFECVNQSLRALNMSTGIENDDVDHNDLRTNRKHEIVIKGGKKHQIVLALIN